MKDSTVLWIAIWAGSSIAAAASKDGGVMIIPGLGMLIWWIFR